MKRRTLMARCKSCPDKKGECRKCKGTGKVDGFPFPRDCDKCGGDGVCSSCNGDGYTFGW
jgi:RecJ-like exonuclease